VGYSINPRKRLHEIRSNSGRAGLTIGHQVTITDLPIRAVERAAHLLLRDKKLRGEWFDVSLDEAIAAIHDAIKLVETSGDSGDQAAVVSVRLEPEIKDALRKAAAEHSLTMSAMIRFAAIEWLRERGYLKKEKPK
jgi:hypothetical protein